MGIVTNIVPGSFVVSHRIRENTAKYVSDTKAYNESLELSDKAFFAMGVTSTIIGTNTMIGGGGATATVVGAPVGIPVAAVGGIVTGVGVSTTVNATNNMSNGYNYGKNDSPSSSNLNTSPTQPTLKNSNLVKVGNYTVGPHGKMPSPRPTDTESHHGVMSAFMKSLFGDKYNANLAPAILMSKQQHAMTKSVFNTWKAQMKKQMGGTFDWAKVKTSDMLKLSKEMLDKAKIPESVRKEYFKQFDKYLKDNKLVNTK